MAENTFAKLKDALNKLSDLLDNAAIRTALGAIPASMKTPLVEGLKQVLNVVKNTVNELKQKLSSLVNLSELFSTTNSLVEAVEGLAPDQRSNLDQVRSVISTLQDATSGQQDIEEILGKIDQLITKLGTL